MCLYGYGCGLLWRQFNTFEHENHKSQKFLNNVITMTLSIILSLLFTLPSAAFLNPNFGLHRSIHQPVRSTPFDNDYKTTGPLPNENKFTLSRTSAPLQSELTDLNLSLILGVVNDIPSVTILPPDDFGSPNPTLTLRSDQPNTNLVSDLEVNTLVWKCLGYRFSGGECAK